MMRKPFVCGNWKLNHNLAETRSILGEMKNSLAGVQQVEYAIAPVATVLAAACEQVKGSALHIAAQNVFYEKKGAFTGEWSVAHLTELGCDYAIVGHSERRALFNESDEIVARKVKACMEGDLIPIACFGENLQQRESDLVKSVVTAQVKSILGVVDSEAAERLILAYEPIWAIGTGKTATAEQAQEVHMLVRALITDQFGQSVAEKIRIIYGGSVNADNAATLMAQKDIDGLLVGGASLSTASFCSIVKSASVLRA